VLSVKLICIVQARLTKVVFCGGSSLYERAGSREEAAQ
jgi:hypothetical protein